MRITLEIDDSAISRIAGEDTGKMLLEEIYKDPCFWVNAADSVRVSGHFGIAEIVHD